VEGNFVCGVDGLAGELRTELRVILDLAAKTGGLGFVIEVGACNLSTAAVEGDVSPDRSPETCTVDGQDGGSVLEDVDRKIVVSLSLDVVVLGLEVGHSVDLSGLGVKGAGFLSVSIHEEGLRDVGLIETEDGRILTVSDNGEIFTTSEVLEEGQTWHISG